MKELSRGFALRNFRMIDEEGNLRSVQQWNFAEGNRVSEALAGAEVIDAQGGILLPLLSEWSVNFKEPGREYTYTLEDGAEAMRRGGFGRVMLSPDTLPVVDQAAHVEGLVKKAQRLGVEMYASAAVSKNLEGQLLPEMVEMIREGALAISNGLRPLPGNKYLHSAMQYASQTGVRVHLWPMEKDLCLSHYFPEGALASRYGLKGIPSFAEEVSVYRILQLAKHTGCPVHIQHVTSPESVRLIVEFKEQGVDVTSDVTLHHLDWSERDLEELDPHLHLIPPLVTEAKQEYLLKSLERGDIDAVSCQHYPVLPEFKNTIFEASEPGISCLETALSSVYTRQGEVGLIDFALKNVVKSSKIMGLKSLWQDYLDGKSWSLFNLKVENEIDKTSFAGNVSNSPYLGRRLSGRVDVFHCKRKTWVN